MNIRGFHSVHGYHSSFSKRSRCHQSTKGYFLMSTLTLQVVLVNFLSSKPRQLPPGTRHRMLLGGGGAYILTSRGSLLEDSKRWPTQCKTLRDAFNELEAAALEAPSTVSHAYHMASTVRISLNHSLSLSYDNRLRPYGLRAHCQCPRMFKFLHGPNPGETRRCIR